MSEMSPAEAIFFAALEEASLAEQAAHLDVACAGQPAMRAQVEKMLAAHPRMGQFLEPSDAAPDLTGAYTSQKASPIESIGSVLAGKYKLLQEVGEGGMGSVFMADQLQPVKRRVAVKVIKAGMDSARVLARFEAERQALALMDHPNIAKVLDAGATESGRPFFVMELVKGIPLTQFCDQHKLTVLDRLNLFMQICSAVQHAHQKGIIHRDLKPTNILVESHDGKPMPKVIDFGLAKATSGIQLSEHTLFTALGQVAGTPLYMAPEQAAFNAVDVDTRADVYALGVILYELLTGTTPIERETFKKAAFDEMMRMIREQEPVAPSSRLSNSEAKASVAAVRQTEPGKLGRFVRGELDWIVLKSLSKERDRRYESATAFAKDIDRFLNHEAVLAGRPSAGYKMQKFVRRNRPQVVAASLVLLALVGGIIGTTFGLIRADAARLAESEQRQIAENKQLEAEAERARAEKAESETLDDYRASADDAIEQLIGSKPELSAQERLYLERTLERWKAFADRKGTDERSRAIRAEGHNRIGLLWARLNHKGEAQTEYLTARDIFKTLVEQFPFEPKLQENLATTHNNLANMLAGIGKEEDARLNYLTARDIQKKLMELNPTVPEYRHELARTHTNLGNLLSHLGKREQARAEYLIARDLLIKLVDQFPAVPGYQRQLALTHNNLGILLSKLGERGDAMTEYKSAGDIQKKLLSLYPSTPAYQQDFAHTQHNLGALHANLGNREGARLNYQAACDLQKKLCGQYPAVPAYQRELARTLYHSGNLLAGLGMNREALAEYQGAANIQAKLAEQFPTQAAFHQELAHTHDSVGSLLIGMGKRDEARTNYESSRNIQQKLVVQFPGISEYQVDLGGSYCNCGNLLRTEGKPAESLKWFDMAIRTLRSVTESEPQNVQAKEFLRNCHENRAFANDWLYKFAEAINDWDRAIELSPPTVRRRYRASRANSQLQAGKVAEAVAEVVELSKLSNWSAGESYDFARVFAVASGKFADKKHEHVDRAMELLHKAVKSGYNDAAYMAKDTDLDPLRGREDFKKLLADLEMKSPPKAQLAPPPREVKP